MAKSLFDHIKKITQESYDPNYWNSLSESDKKTFSSYMIHRFISMNPDWVDIANIFQTYSYNLKPELVYKLYSSAIPNSRVFLKYIKGSNSVKFSTKLIDLISQYFEVSRKESTEYLTIFSNMEDGVDRVTDILKLNGIAKKEITSMMKGFK
mgnify:CR=1 FL=1